jgi:hypothetical protein
MSAREAQIRTGGLNARTGERGRNAPCGPGKRGMSRYRVDVTAKPSSLTGSVAVALQWRLERPRGVRRLDVDDRVAWKIASPWRATNESLADRHGTLIIR